MGRKAGKSSRMMDGGIGGEGRKGKGEMKG